MRTWREPAGSLRRPSRALQTTATLDARHMLFARRASLALGGGAAVALVAWPERPGEPSVRTVLRWLPSGLLGWALHPTGARVPSLEVVQREACSNVAVQLCGVCHVETASAEAARACVERCSASGGACC